MDVIKKAILAGLINMNYDDLADLIRQGTVTIKDCEMNGVSKEAIDILKDDFPEKSSIPEAPLHTEMGTVSSTVNTNNFSKASKNSNQNSNNTNVDRPPFNMDSFRSNVRKTTQKKILEHLIYGEIVQDDVKIAHSKRWIIKIYNNIKTISGDKSSSIQYFNTLVTKCINFEDEESLEESWKDLLLDIDKTKRIQLEEDERIRRAREIEEKKKYHLEQLRNRNIYSEYYREDTIRGLIEDGSLTKQDIIEAGILTPVEFESVKSRTNIDYGFTHWKKLPDLKQDRTDVYFFGQSGAGKSSILAGLLYYLDKNGMMGVESSNPTGRKYRDKLIQCVKRGTVPMRTLEDVINYIEVDLKHDDPTLYAPLNFIEMSGESFKDAYDNGVDGVLKDIGAKEYLKNNNKKIIVFIIDYFTHTSGEDVNQEVEQQAILKECLNLIAKDGTLKQTEAIFLFVSKADLIKAESEEDRRIKAIKFIDDHYSSLAANLKSYKDNGFNFKLVVEPVSVGEFIFEKTYRYRSVSSKKFTNELKEYAYKVKYKNSDKSFLDKLLGK